MVGLSASQILDYEPAASHANLGGLADLVAPQAGTRLPVGCTDAALFRLRAATFGPTLACITDCVACGEALEFSMPVASLLAPTSATEPSHHWASREAEIDYRLPTYDDLSALRGLTDQGVRETALLERLVLGAALNGVRVAAADLPEQVVEDLAADMAAHDPQADMSFELTCPDCGCCWSATLDIADFFSRELIAEARRLLGQVDALARAYGWSESEILALSERRRRAYLDLLEAGSVQA